MLPFGLTCRSWCAALAYTAAHIVAGLSCVRAVTRVLSHVRRDPGRVAQALSLSPPPDRTGRLNAARCPKRHRFLDDIRPLTSPSFRPYLLGTTRTPCAASASPPSSSCTLLHRRARASEYLLFFPDQCCGSPDSRAYCTRAAPLFGLYRLHSQLSCISRATAASGLSIRTPLLHIICPSRQSILSAGLLAWDITTRSNGMYLLESTPP